MESHPHFRLLNVLALACLIAAGTASAQPSRLPAAGPDLSEAGAPLFSILSRANLGVDLPPTDLHLMPDGRVLVVAGQQLALGDGVRWEPYRQAADDEDATGLNVAVDDDGAIYQAIRGGFARVDFGTDGRWRLIPVASWPDDGAKDQPTPRHAIVSDDNWYWHAGGGTIMTWRPGQPARKVGVAQSIEQIFSFDGKAFLSENNATGSRILDGKPDPAILDVLNSADGGIITCITPATNGKFLIGTFGDGVHVLTQSSNVPLSASSLLAEGRRVTDICATGNGYYAAAVENVGVVFFDELGRIHQTLPRSLDQRLGRVSRLVADGRGIVWAVLADGILRVAFPSRVSHFDLIIETALTSAHPVRHERRLWLMSNWMALRADYDTGGKLGTLFSDSPPNPGVFSLSSGPAGMIAANSQGAYLRESLGWRQFAPGIRNFYLLQPEATEGPWLYAAEDEIGWLHRIGQDYTVERTPTPELGTVYGSQTDATGAIWLERGTGLVARVLPIRPGQKAPEVELFDQSHGVPETWVQAFVIDGQARFNIADRIFRFDETTRYFVIDDAFERQFAEYGMIVGRPGRDSLGRLWLSTAQGIHLFEGKLGQLRRVEEQMPPGFQPIFFAFETGGVVWMHAPGRLVRYDPAVPATSPSPLRAQITRLTLPKSNRSILAMDRTIPPLPYSDNSIVAHFVGLGDPFAPSTVFEVTLAEAGDAWISAGSSGSAVFDGLKEGNYMLRVRPRSGTTVGEEASLAISILPPWYRTTWAYLAYLLATVGAVVFAARLMSFLDRREKARLERLVTLRTRELRTSEDQLRRAVESGLVGLWELDASAGTLAWNEQCNHLHGLPPGTRDVTLQEFESLLHPADRTATLQALQTAHEGQAALRIEYRIQTPDGIQRWATAVGRSVNDPSTGQPRMRGAMLDITERKQAEESIRSLNTSLEHRVAERTAELQAANTELESFSYSISHDLRAPLRGIDGWSLALVEDYGPTLDATALDYLQRVRNESQRLGHLIDDLLKLSRTTRAQLHPMPVDLSALVAETAQRVRDSRPECRAEFVCQDGLRTITDPGLLGAALFNLLDNACKFSSKVTAPRVEFGLAETPQGPAYFVRDNGAGFDMRHARNLFGAFQRMHTQAEFPGTGVGLATVQRIIHRHGGRIWAESKLGEQTTFYFTLPQDGA